MTQDIQPPRGKAHVLKQNTGSPVYRVYGCYDPNADKVIRHQYPSSIRRSVTAVV